MDRGWSTGPLPHLGSKGVDRSVGKQGAKTVRWDVVRRIYQEPYSIRREK